MAKYLFLFVVLPLKNYLVSDQFRRLPALKFIFNQIKL